MFSPSMMTYTGSIVNQIEGWSQPRVSSLSNVLLPTRLLGAAEIAIVGTGECIATGLQFLLLLAPVIVKKTLQVLRMRSLSERLPHMGIGTLWTLFRRTIALSLVVLLGTPAMLWQPETGIHVYDAMGLQRRVISIPISEQLKPVLKRVGRVAASAMTLIKVVAAHLQIVATHLYHFLQNYPEVLIGAGIGAGSWLAYRQFLTYQFTGDQSSAALTTQKGVTSHEVVKTPFGILQLPEWKWNMPSFADRITIESVSWGLGIFMVSVLVNEVRSWRKASSERT